MFQCNLKLSVICLVMLPGLCPLLSAATGKDLVKTRLIADVKEIKPGEPFHLGLLLTISPHWHIYWINPGDSGAPTVATLQLPKGFTAGPWQYPVPQKITDAAGTVFGYTDEVLLIATVTPDASIPTGTQSQFSCNAHWLVCQKVCIMGAGATTLSLPLGADTVRDNRELFSKWIARVPTPANHAKVRITTSGRGASQRWSGTIGVRLPPGVQNPQWFPGPSDVIAAKNIHVSVRQNQADVSFTAERIGDPKASPGTIASVLAYDLADGSRAGMQIPVSFDLSREAK